MHRTLPGSKCRSEASLSSLRDGGEDDASIRTDEMTPARASRTGATERRPGIQVLMRRLILALCLIAATSPQAQEPPPGMLSPSRPVPTGKAPKMQFKLIHQTAGERVYAIIFSRGDEAISGLTDFAVQNQVLDAHFTAVGAIDGALLAWFDIPKKSYRPIPIPEQCEVLAFTGDIAAFNGKPVVHAHSILGRSDGSTRGGHTFELHVNPTLEVFLTADDMPLGKKQDPGGLKLIDPAQ